MEYSTQGYRAFCTILKWNPSWSSTIGSTTVISITSPLAILLNASLIVAVLKKKKLQSICNILVASMAASDLLIGAVAQPLFLSAGLYRLQGDYEKMCTIILAGFFAMYLQSASIYHLTFITLERYIAIAKGLNYKFIITRSRLKACITVIWVLTVVSIVPSGLYISGLIGKETRNVANASLFTVPLSICLLATVTFYFKIYLKTRQSKVNKTTFISFQVARAILQKKIAKTAFLLTVCLLVFFVPTFVFIFLTYLFRYNHRDMYLWSVILIQLNSCASPILYFYRNRRFRNTVLQMLNIKKSETNAIAPRAGRKEMLAKSKNDNEAAASPNHIGPQLQIPIIGKQHTAKPDTRGESMTGEMKGIKEPRTAWKHPKNFTTPKKKVNCFGDVEGHSQAHELRERESMAAKTGTQCVTQQNVHLSPKEITGEKKVSSLYQDTSGPGTSKRCQEIVSTGELRISLPFLEFTQMRERRKRATQTLHEQ